MYCCKGRLLRGFICVSCLLLLLLASRWIQELDTSTVTQRESSASLARNSFNSRHLIHVITTFPLLLDPDWTGSGYAQLSAAQKEARMDEYIVSLSRTLIHPQIKEVHLLYDQPLFPTYIRGRLEEHHFRERLVFHSVNDTKKAFTSFQFAFDNFQDRLVMVTQADVYPERGFDLIDYNILQGERLMYALTRHGKLEERCNMSGDFCDEGQEYVGSHDSYIFVPMNNLSLKTKHYLSKDTTSWGIDLVITWVFQNVEHYRVLNPCKVIFVYHVHCTYIRNVNRSRVNTDNTTGWVIPSDRLY